MRRVKVRRGGISSRDAVEVMKRALGEGYLVRAEDKDGTILVRRGSLGRAKVQLHDEPDGTVFYVRGQSGGFYPVIMLAVNTLGIARRVAAAIGEAAEFRD
jgi:hypothetical protein